MSIFRKIRDFFTPERVAAATGFLTGLAGLIGGYANALPGSWQNTAVAGVGLLVSGASIIKWLDGALHFSLTPMGQAKEQARLGLLGVEAPVFVEEDILPPR